MSTHRLHQLLLGRSHEVSATEISFIGLMWLPGGQEKTNLSLTRDTRIHGRGRPLSCLQEHVFVGGTCYPCRCLSCWQTTALMMKCRHNPSVSSRKPLDTQIGRLPVSCTLSNDGWVDSFRLHQQSMILYTFERALMSTMILCLVANQVISWQTRWNGMRDSLWNCADGNVKMWFDLACSVSIWH